MADDFVYGVCPDCGYVYTEPIENFANWLPPGCPRCESKTTPYPITDDELPKAPPLLPLTVEQAFKAPKTWLLLLLIKDIGYRLGMWVGVEGFEPFQEAGIRYLGIGGERGSTAIRAGTIVAAWQVGEREELNGR